MSEAKFTPGPWHVSDGGFGKIPNHHPSVYATDDNLRYIATCADYASIPRTNNLANAHLIAASPDFYAAAKAMCDRHDETARAANFVGCGCDECMPFRKIIAKVEIVQ